MSPQLSAARLRRVPQEPPSFVATPDSILRDVESLLERERLIHRHIVSHVDPSTATFENVLLPLAQAANATALEGNVLGFYKDVSTCSELRDASSRAQKILKNFVIKSLTNEPLFHLIDAVWKRKEDLDLDVEDRHLLEKEYKDRIRCGLNLPSGPERVRFQAIQERLNQIKIKFRSNLAIEGKGLWVTRDEMDGVPDDVVSALQEGQGANSGKLYVSVGNKHLLPTLQYATNSSTRKNLYIAHENKCPQNVPLFKEAVILRDEAARLLGYPDHATFSLGDKMAKKPEVVKKFLGGLQASLTHAGLREIEKLKRLKESHLAARGESYDGRFYLWDNTYYRRVMLENGYNIDQLKISEYFPLQTTIRAMLETFQQLFGLVFVKIADIADHVLGEVPYIAWHDEVEVFSVWNNDNLNGEFIGYFYMDLFGRPGKYGNSSCFNLQPGFLHSNGRRHHPATALLCSFDKPSTQKPYLLRHNEVVVLFHELGHGIHDLVSKTKYGRFHGINVAVDFGEAPSQMLENWCWTPSVLNSFGRHYSYLSSEYLNTWEESSQGETRPSERMADETVNALVATRHVNQALFTLRQLHISTFDMVVYTPESHEAIQNFDFQVEYNKSRKEITLMDGPEILDDSYGWGHGFANLGHLISEYDAGYYSYLSSNVYASDIFRNVFEPNLLNSAEGLRYRHEFLEKGGSQEEMKTLVDFLGREPNAQAFRRELGLE